MGIYKTIQENAIKISMKQSKHSDTFLYFDINEALTHIQILLDGLKNTITEIKTVENLFDYFIAKRISTFATEIDSVKEAEQQEKLKKLIDVALIITDAFSIGEIIKFINNDYKKIIIRNNTDKDMQELFFPLVEFCIKYQSGISDEVFLFLAMEHWFVFINYYDDLKKKLLSSPSLYELVFAKENIKSLICSKCQNLLKIAKSISATKQIGTDCLILLNTHIIFTSIEILKTAKDRELLAYGDSMRRVHRYFSEIDYDQQVIVEFENAYKVFEKNLNEYLENNGSKFSEEIPSDIVDRIFSSNSEWIFKLLCMTHSLKNDSMVSVFTYDDLEPPAFIDIVAHNIDTDEYFTFSRQQKIQISASVGTALLMQIYRNPSYIKKYILWIVDILYDISKERCIEEEGLITDLLEMVNSLHFIEELRKNKEFGHSCSFVYGTCMLIIACIEKVLRIIYKIEKNVILSDEVIQLGPLLNNEVIEKILTKDLMKGVGFYLSRYDYIGLNYRNRLAHLSNIKIDEIPPSLPYTLFYLYMCVINGIFIYYCLD